MKAVCHEAASRKRPSTPTLLRRPSRWGLCGRCSHFGRTIHATHCQRCVWRHLAWTVIFGLRHAVLRQYIPRKFPFGYTFSCTMHHTSSQKGLRSGWQSGASEPHLLTRRCSNRRKFCGPSAPIAYATSGIFCKEAGAMVAAWKRLLTDECYSIFSSTQSSGTVQKSPGISFLSNTTNAPPSGTMCHLIFHLPSS